MFAVESIKILTRFSSLIWVWASSQSWWWTGKPGVLQSMESQRVGHDWATELNWTEAGIFTSLNLTFFFCKGTIYTLQNAHLLDVQFTEFGQSFTNITDIYTCIHHLNQNIEHFHYPWKFLPGPYINQSIYFPISMTTVESPPILKPHRMESCRSSGFFWSKQRFWNTSMILWCCEH